MAATGTEEERKWQTPLITKDTSSAYTRSLEQIRLSGKLRPDLSGMMDHF